ncbi:MAG: hypothetical protein CM1200mP18_18980 [Gammaproteobacteria bacterium]|nr:MAG: hypothetical protein CM1200mP18_18980 [Gammaproteobacteria bacterium]
MFAGKLRSMVPNSSTPRSSIIEMTPAGRGHYEYLVFLIHICDRFSSTLLQPGIGKVSLSS